MFEEGTPIKFFWFLKLFWEGHPGNKSLISIFSDVIYYLIRSKRASSRWRFLILVLFEQNVFQKIWSRSRSSAETGNIGLLLLIHNHRECKIFSQKNVWIIEAEKNYPNLFKLCKYLYLYQCLARCENGPTPSDNSPTKFQNVGKVPTKG